MKTDKKQGILIVDESAEKRTQMKNILQKEFCVLEAENEGEAAKILKNYEVDFCVMLPDSYRALTGLGAVYSAQLKRLEEKASLDPLTGLLNHAAARKRMEERLRGHEESKFAFIIFDLDYFKLANDTYGHKFGDDVLIYIAETLRSVLRKEDLAVRIGGDEFLIILEYHEDIEPVADRIFQILKGNDEHFPISISMGISMTENNIREYDTLFKRADKALYAAKRGGRGRYVFYDDMMDNMFSVLSPIEGAEEDKRGLA